VAIEGMSSDTVVLRPVADGDQELLVEIYASTRAEELALTDWSEAQRDAFVKMQFAAQQEYYRAHYPQAEHNIILRSLQPVGRFYTAETEDDIRIIDITVLPDHRNAGIGTPLINDLLTRAKEVWKPVRIYVETYNRSRRLFERLGFTVIEEDGINVLLECRPSVDRNAP
jgi:ribosomal protein S18 acetylase RimI-like enzyme